MHLADAFIQSDLQFRSYIFSSVCDAVENNKYCVFALFYSANVVGCPDNLSQRYFKECFVYIMKVTTQFEPHWLKSKNSDRFQNTFLCVLLKLYETTNIMSCPSFYSGRVVGCPGNRGSHVLCSESGSKYVTLGKKYYIHILTFPEQSLSIIQTTIKQAI